MLEWFLLQPCFSGTFTLHSCLSSYIQEVLGIKMRRGHSIVKPIRFDNSIA